MSLYFRLGSQVFKEFSQIAKNYREIQYLVQNTPEIDPIRKSYIDAQSVALNKASHLFRYKFEEIIDTAKTHPVQLSPFTVKIQSLNFIQGEFEKHRYPKTKPHPNRIGKLINLERRLFTDLEEEVKKTLQNSCFITHLKNNEEL